DENGNFTTTPPHLQERTENKLEDIQISVPKKEEREAVETVRNGRVKFFNTEKGYGFIIDDETGDSFFAFCSLFFRLFFSRSFLLKLSAIKYWDKLK
ncbi:MAG: hypothetical protein AAFQ92_19365, partial [Bacteroidota bacterium]